MTDRYARPAERCPPPADRPILDLEARCPPERREALERLEVRSTHRCRTGDRRTLARDGISMLGHLMGRGPEPASFEALALFGERAFRMALHHAHPGAISPLLWKYWHLRLHGEPPRRPAPTVISEMKAAEALPDNYPEPGPTQWPPRRPGGPVDYRTCLQLFG